MSTTAMPNTQTLTVQDKLAAIRNEMVAVHKQREDVVDRALTALVANQHVLLVGKPGSGKSFLFRDLSSRIADGEHFETALDEKSDPAQIAGPTDVKGMVEQGKFRRVIDGTLMTCTTAFIDEALNANGPTLHHMQPPLNERIYHNNGTPVPIPLRSAFMATNKLLTDVDTHALWDRIHIRMVVDYIKGHDIIRDVIKGAIKRNRYSNGGTDKTTITLAELDQAHTESLDIEYSDDLHATHMAIVDELAVEGIEVSTRRITEGARAVLAKAYIAGEAKAKVLHLDILQDMYWDNADHIDTVQRVVLAYANPGETEALDLLRDVDKIRENYAQADDEDLDQLRKDNIHMEVVRDLRQLLEKANPLRAKAVDNGLSTRRVDHLIETATTMLADVTEAHFS